MVALIIAFPNLVSGGIAKKAPLDTSNVILEVQPADTEEKEVDVNKLFGIEPAASAASR
jgi:hypothetical protein